ncbi:bile acid:sodium symporter family protein [Salinisphaera aquimarina]|uniref:Bile acid:sodium symporter family protein n=1 Tax=Salinisphaera aquimarina TaxID=2094031 RepID=A0ABV7EK06_9GAMM
MRNRIDPFTVILLGAIVVAAFAPARGGFADVLAWLGEIAIALLFFLHGAALSRASVREGATHWRLHLLILCITFVCFPLVVLPISALAPAWMPPALALGFLYLGALPSAVSSSIAFTAMAGGNVPAAICSAAASNVFGMMATPFVFMLLAQSSGGQTLAVGHALQEIILQLLVPFAAGQLLRPWLANLIDRHKHWTGRYDQIVILLIVYTAFSQFVASGFWRQLPASAIGFAVGLCALILAIMIAFSMFVSRRLGFSLGDEAAVVFCGSKKSLASGLPMANVLFAGNPALGMIILPIMVYNQIQIIVGAMVARRYERTLTARTDDDAAALKSPSA